MSQNEPRDQKPGKAQTMAEALHDVGVNTVVSASGNGVLIRVHDRFTPRLLKLLRAADGTEPVAPGEQAVEPHEIPRSDLVDSELVKDLFREVRAAHLDPPLFPAGVGRQFCGSCGVVLVSVEDGCQACGAQSSSEWMTCPHGACLERVYVAGTECVRCESAVDQCPGCEAPLWTEHVNECWNCGQTLIDYGPQFRQPPHPAFPPSAHVAIQIARLRGDTTQQQLADRLGVTQPTVSQWESHKRRVSLDDLPAIARALSCRVSDLLPPEEATDA